MGKRALGLVLLAGSLVGTACGGSDGTGSGGSGDNEAYSFDSQTSLDVGPSVGAALAISEQLGAVVSNALSSAGSGLVQGLAPKGVLPGFCQSGTADLTLNLSQPGSLTSGDTIVLTLMDCAGSPISQRTTNGAIEVQVDSVSGVLPVIGGILDGRIELDLGIDPDTQITGDFAFDANLPNLTLINLTLGDEASDDLITKTEGFFRAEFACFEIFQRIFLGNGNVEFFRPLGVLRQGTEVFTMNDYNGTPDNIEFAGPGLDAVPESGSLTLDSGDLSGGICASFSGSPTPNDSFVTATFTGGGCVSLVGMDTAGASFSTATRWDTWLDAGQPGQPDPACEGGTGGTGGGGGQTTNAMQSPVSCFEGDDLIANVDAYITGTGPEPDRMLADTNFGTAGNLILKSVQNLGFTRKVYIQFDLGGLPIDFSPAAAYLILTLERHVENPTPELSGPQPVNVFGITDADDWDPVVLAETDITWNNAPKNVVDSPTEFETEGVEPIVAAYDFDLGGDDVIDPPLTKYAIDVTSYIAGRLAANDDLVTLLLVVSNPTLINADGSVFFSREATDVCDAPFLHFQ